MKRNSKRFLSLFLAVPMSLSLISMPVSATTTNSQVLEETAEPEESAVPAADESEAEAPQAEEENASTDLGGQGTITFSIEDSTATLSIDTSEINVNEMQLSQEELDAIDRSDPEIATIEEELKSITVLNADGESVALTEEQISTVLGMYSQYQEFWQEHADVLGVQSPFYLMFNDDGEDGLGVLGEMLTLAGVPVDDVRSGDYSYDDLTGMILNFQYGDIFGVRYYGDEVKEKRNEALAYVESTGAKTDVQKMLALNTWIAQNNSFDMAYIMNQMDSDNPIMSAENPQKNEHYDDMAAELYEVYVPIITAQFYDPIYSQIEAYAYNLAIESAFEQEYRAENPDADDDTVAAAVETYMTENADAIAADPYTVLVNLLGEEAAEAQKTQIETEAQAQAEASMDEPMEDMGGLTPNQMVETYAQQAADALVNGIIGYWEGNHIGVFTEEKSVCMGYAKTFAYLVQCMYPEYYLVDGATDINVASNWKTAADLYYDDEGNLDINQEYNVDLVRITFDANVSMYGIPQPDFNSDHFWNAVKIDGEWYYVDPCYTDVFSEVMNRDRVETDGYMNHLYFMLSHSSTAEMFDGNYKEIKTLYANCDGTTVNADYTSDDYEGSWISRVTSNVYSDGSYFYYFYDSMDMLEMLREFNESNGNYSDLDFDESVYKIVRHAIDDDDKGDGDTDYETLIDFNSGDTVTVRNADGEMETNEMLTELYAQFVEEQDIYPSISITPVLNDGVIYFNLSNCIISYDLTSCEVAEVKEYNTVYAEKDPTVVFAGMAFHTTEDAESADFTFVNHPIAGMALKGDGTLYVDIATNLSYIAGKDPHNYADTDSYGYEYEESNYNPDYSEYTSSLIGDSGLDEDTLESMGYSLEKNDNAEFMWVANVVDKVDMEHFAGDSHTYEDVTVDPYCNRDGYTESRCTECGAIEQESRVTDEGTACDHHYLLFEETYYTTDDTVTSETDPDTVNWNEGVAYVCAMCGFSISEPTEPQKSNWVTDEEYEELYAEYEREKAIYDVAVATAGHVYEATDAAWSDDCSTVTFSNLVCNSVCEERKNALDLLLNDESISMTLETPITAEAVLASSEGDCTEGAVATYTAEGETEDGIKYFLTTTKQLNPGQHAYVGEFTWTEVTDEEGNVTGYTAVANATCSACGATAEGVEATVTLDETQHVDPTCTEAGKDVYVATAVILDEDGNEIGTVTDSKEVELPAAGHSFENGVCTVCGEEQGNPFVDVSEDVYYYEPILWAFKNGIVTGIDSEHFAPEESCIRADVITIIWRYAGSPETETTENPFVDVDEDSYYYDAVLWAYENGITTGKDSTHFVPYEEVSRAQLLTMFYRLEGSPEVGGDNPFTDVPEDEYYTEAVLWAYQNGVTTGIDETQFAPDDICTRGETVTFLYRVDQLGEES